MGCEIGLRLDTRLDASSRYRMRDEDLEASAAASAEEFQQESAESRNKQSELSRK